MAMSSIKATLPSQVMSTSRPASGLTTISIAQATAPITGSGFGCYISKGPIQESDPPSPSQAVVTGRISGNDGWCFVITGKAVLPEHQRKGLGDAVLKMPLNRIKERATKGRPMVLLGRMNRDGSFVPGMVFGIHRQRRQG
ncbi:hypothetical protein B0O99DRAFT_711801 [Bisporella sp. PMI_857]|nr:hypothetical protein B0O99DRAFT_711801 [Bisporella sp. PMI_857]